jgi:hypothetical protein
LGDWIDPYFINYLLEHWHHSIHNLTDPSSPPIFFPVRRTLGYSHGLILFVPFYEFARVFFDPLIAYNLTILVVLVSGSMALFALLRHAFGLTFVESSALTLFFITSRNVINSGTGIWTQRASIFLYPLIFLLGCVATRVRERRLAAVLNFAFGLLLSLMFTQDFYTAQLGLLMAALLVPPLLPTFLRQARVYFGDVWNAIGASRPHTGWIVIAAVAMAWSIVILIHPKRPLLVAFIALGWVVCRLFQARRSLPRPAISRDRIVSLGAIALGGAVGATVFLWIYLPSYLEHRSFPEELLVSQLIYWRNAFHAYDSYRMFLLVFIAVAAWWTAVRDRRTPDRRLVLWLVVVSLIVFLIPLRTHTWSVWQIAFAWLPGLSPIRDPKRIISLLELAIVLSIGWSLANTNLRRAFSRIVVLAIAVLLFVDWNPERFRFERDEAEFERWVTAPIAVDPVCESFAIAGASRDYMSRSPHVWMLYAGDAMFIALSVSVPTLNGYSAWWPQGWNLFNPPENDYDEALASWIAQHQLQRVCTLDIDNRTMRLLPVRQ